MPPPVASYADSATIAAHIADRLNAAATWAGDIVKKIYSEDSITNARRQSTAEVLAAVASNPKHGAFGLLATLVDVDNDSYLPPHDGEPGIPIIIAFEGATARRGLVAAPTQIDSWRANASSFTGVVGPVVAHDAKSKDGKASPLSCRWSIVDEYLTFTGKSAQVPLVIITDALVDTKLLLSLAPAVVKLAMPKLIKPGSAITQIARQDAADGREDLLAIQNGAMSARPLRDLPDVAVAQRRAAV